MYKRGLKLGFIKGGQLAKMMLQVAPSFDIHTMVMDDDAHCPCRFLCHEYFSGDAMNFDDVVAFGKRVDILTFEYEHVNVAALRQLKASGVAVYPDPDILALVQNKGKQKEFYRQHGFPTANYRLVNNRKLLTTHTDFLPAVQKLCVGGYDGRGIYKINSTQDIDGAFDAPCVLEQAVDIDREIAVVVARNMQGDIKTFEAVEMVFHPTKHLVELLRAPASISPELANKAYALAEDLVKKLDLVGVLAVEFFVDKKGDLLINEIAPRVHNSGHHTIEANFTSQFEQHLRAVMGLPLGITTMASPAVMINILGDEGYEGYAKYEGVEQALGLGGVYIHLYGKEITKPFRKMGHATIVDNNIDVALTKARQVKDIIRVRA